MARVPDYVCWRCGKPVRIKRRTRHTADELESELCKMCWQQMYSDNSDLGYTLDMAEVD